MGAAWASSHTPPMADDLAHRERGRARGAAVTERLEALVALGAAASRARQLERAGAMDEVAAYLASLPLEVPRAQAVRLAAGLLGLGPDEAEELAATAAAQVAGRAAGGLASRTSGRPALEEAA